MAGINDLPIELFALIFGYLNLTIDDLFKFRLINKKFKSATFNCVNKLTINESDQERNDFWFNNDELVNDDYMISSKCFSEIRLRSIFNLNVYLKYLRINFKKDHSNEFKKELLNFNDLINLECLEMYSNDYKKYKGFKLDLNLENLRYFKFKIHGLDIPCKLNTPELEKIEILKINLNKNNPKILIKNPESIKHLIADDYEEGSKIFINLEILEFNHASKLDENLLSFFINLKQLKINGVNHRNNELKNCLLKILQKRKKSNRNIDIYLEGVKLIDINKFKEYQSYDYNIFDFQLDNYDLLDFNMPSNTCIQYHRLNNYYHNLRRDLPSSFFNKCKETSNIFVAKEKHDKPINAKIFNWFLNNLECLKTLQINDILFDQHFFDNLPLTIRVLNICDQRKKLYIDSNINFDFILKLPKLVEFVQDGWDTDILDLISASFLNLKYFRFAGFWYKDHKIIVIRKKKKFHFELSHYYNSKCQLDYDQLIQKFNQLKTRRSFNLSQG